MSPLTDSWRPNWRDPSAYPVFNDEQAMLRWAWEFLRRKPEFESDQKVVEDLKRQISQHKCENKKTAIRQNIAWYCSKHQIHWDAFMPPESNWCQSIGFYATAMAAHSKLDEPLIVQPDLNRYLKLEKNLVLCIDLSLNPEEQMKRYKNLVKEYHARYIEKYPEYKPSKKAQSNYPFYLRLLDAIHEDSETHLNIASIVYPEGSDAAAIVAGKVFRNDRAKAELLRDKEYIHIAAAQPFQK